MSNVALMALDVSVGLAIIVTCVRLVQIFPERVESRYRELAARSSGPDLTTTNNGNELHELSAEAERFKRELNLFAHRAAEARAKLPDFHSAVLLDPSMIELLTAELSNLATITEKSGEDSLDAFNVIAPGITLLDSGGLLSSTTRKTTSPRGFWSAAWQSPPQTPTSYYAHQRSKHSGMKVWRLEGQGDEGALPLLVWGTKISAGLPEEADHERTI